MSSESSFVCFLSFCVLCICAETSNEDLKIEVTKESDNCIARAKNGDYLSIHYTGRLSNGVTFATSLPNQHPQTPYYPGPYRFTLGKKQVIQGYEIGMQGMCVGEHRRFTMPPHLAYGDRGDGGLIPPGATITFDVELVNIERAGGLKSEKSKIFTQMDTNNDMKISKQEMMEYFRKFGRLPDDTADRLELRANTLFEKEDKDKDGFISLEDLRLTKRSEEL